MKTITDRRLMQKEAEGLRKAGQRIAVVPTMGALHEGHLTLIREARKRGDVVIVTVFVNPKQFAEGEDYKQYPRGIADDAVRAGGAGADILFAPDVDGMYGPGFQTHITVEHVTLPLEGKSRPGHFRGVATVVAKLLNITKPHVAVFGQKDAQQALVVDRMVRDLDFDVELVVVPTVREADGVAMSSRNASLTPEQRRESPALHASLLAAVELIRKGERSSLRVIAAMKDIIQGTSGRIDYVSVADAGTLQEAGTLMEGQTVMVSLAVRFGKTRLIDNIQLKV